MAEVLTPLPENHDGNKDKKIGYYLLGNFYLIQAKPLEKAPLEKLSLPPIH
jgi:hypothetical protein